MPLAWLTVWSTFSSGKWSPHKAHLRPASTQLEPGKTSVSRVIKGFGTAPSLEPGRLKWLVTINHPTHIQLPAGAVQMVPPCPTGSLSALGVETSADPLSLSLYGGWSYSFSKHLCTQFHARCLRHEAEKGSVVWWLGERTCVSGCGLRADHR